MQSEYKTLIKTFYNIPISERELPDWKYTDLVSYVAFICVIPMIMGTFILITPLLGFNLLLSYIHWDFISVALEFLIRKLTTLTTLVYKSVAYPCSILLCGVYYPYVTYCNNMLIMTAMDPVSLDVVDFSKLPNVHRNAIMKNGSFSVWLRVVVMFSVLPAIRYILSYNPFLFQLSLVFTNQKTADIPDEERTEANFQMLEMIFHTYAKRVRENKRLDAVNFNPNYTETNTDDGKFNDIGLQYMYYFTSYIQMELPKFRKELERFEYVSPIVSDGVKCKLLDRLWIPYSNPFHALNAYVEVILTENGSLQHPMMGVFSNSVYSHYSWARVDKLFNINVMAYISELYEKYKLPNTTINILSP